MNDEAILTMNLDDAIRLRRSVRGFLPTEVPAASLLEVFGCRARRAGDAARRRALPSLSRS